MNPRRALSIPLLILSIMVVGCAQKSDQIVAVTGTDKACTADVARATAGKVTITFTNTASEVSEIYIFDKDGQIVGEIEDVTTGTTRSLTADLKTGDYELRCKPGMIGDGFSTTLSVSAT